MATNTLAPNGLTVGGARQALGAAANYAHTVAYIRDGYTSSAIGRGDLVNLGTGSDRGFVVISAHDATKGYGVFVSVYGYYDTTLQQWVHGLNGSYQTGASPSGNIQCFVVTDPFVTFKAQIQGSTGWTASWFGQNINWVTGTNGAPNASGQSTLALDPDSIGDDPTLPFRIVGPLGVSGGPEDPANVNPWIEVRLNTSWLLSSTGA